MWTSYVVGLLIVGAVASAAGPQRVTFDYGWKFSLGDPTSASPPLTTASIDPTFTTDVSNQTCSQLAWSQLGRMASDDCRGACSATPGCKVWQFNPGSGGALPHGCSIHDGTLGDSPVCTVNPPTAYIGGARTVVPPPVQNRSGVTWAAPDFDDSSWSSVDAPHDFILLGSYTEEADSHHGYLPRNLSGWYRKTFSLPESFAGGMSWIHFEGVFQAADVWINGHHVLRHTSGYLGFDIDLTAVPAIAYGVDATNVIVIRVDASFGSGHWYEGGGLVRQSWLSHSPGQARFSTDGLFAQPEGSTVTSTEAKFTPTVEVDAIAAVTAVLRWTVTEQPGGQVVEHKESAPTQIAAGAGHVIQGAPLVVSNPSIWGIKSPVLYRLTVELVVDGAVIDVRNSSIGFRNIDWKSSGFRLNDEQLRIRGFSHHSDFGAVGAAVPDRVNLFRANALRGVGGNTWRTSHNPYRPAVYEILNTVGILVWDENRDFNQLNIDDMSRLVRRDRNHPSVVIWSACNEIECYVTGPANVTGVEMMRATKAFDTTRPFSANLNQDGPFNVNDTQNYLANYMDVEGFSHGTIAKPGATQIHQANPNKAVISSECCSCRTQRQEDYQNQTEGLTFTHDLEQAQCMQSCMNLSYPSGDNGNNPTPSMGAITGTLGVWTLFDYAGASSSRLTLSTRAVCCGHSRLVWNDPFKQLLARSPSNPLHVHSRLDSPDSATGTLTPPPRAAGEPGPWPQVGSAFGQFDLAGFAKSAAYWYRGLWLATPTQDDPGRPPLPETHVVRISQGWVAPPPTGNTPIPPACNVTQWAMMCPSGAAGSTPQACLACCKAHEKELFKMGCTGVDVWPTYCNPPGTGGVQVFSDLPTIELFLNGQSQGKQPCTPSGFAHFPAVTYTPGNLTAVGLSSTGAAVARHEIVSAGVAAAIELSIDVPSAKTGTGSALVLDGHDCGLVRATVVDGNGRAVGTASDTITFEIVSGPGRVAGVHNGDAKSHEPQLSSTRSAYHGLARAAIKVTADATDGAELLQQVDRQRGDGVQTVALTPRKSAGPIVVKASAPGLGSSTVSIAVSTDLERHSVLATAAASLKTDFSLD